MPRPDSPPRPAAPAPAAASAPEPAPEPARKGRRIQTRRSPVHGNGVFAARDIAAGERLIEYKGEVISWKEALRRHPHDPAQPHHTFFFHVDDKRVIDGGANGNASRWINHSCEPNCIADEHKGRVYIKALRDIASGEELNYDYGLIIDEPYTPELLANYPCWCGTPSCRGTLLSPPDESDMPGRGKKKKRKKAEKAEKAGKAADKQAKKKKKAKASKKDKKARKAGRDKKR